MSNIVSFLHNSIDMMLVRNSSVVKCSEFGEAFVYGQLEGEE
jgi:hypothetical protein